MEAWPQRRQAAQRALQSFTQDALWLRAKWAENFHPLERPSQSEYESIKDQGREARALAKQAFPAAYAYVFRAARATDVPPNNVPAEEQYAIRLIVEARGAMVAVRSMWKAWEYAVALPTAAHAA